MNRLRRCGAQGALVLAVAGLALTGLFPLSSVLLGFGHASATGSGGTSSDTSSTSAFSPSGTTTTTTTNAPINYDKALTVCTQAILNNPENPTNYFTRGMVYFIKGDNDKAIADLTDAIKLDPQNAKYYCYRGTAHGAKAEKEKSMKEDDLAIADFSQAITLDSQYGEAYYGRGSTYADKSEYKKAVADYLLAIQFNPTDPEAYNNYAWVLSTCPDASLRDGKKAIEYATKACELSQWKEPASLDTLAAAYAEAGDFANAVKWENQCLAVPNIPDDIASGGRDRLALYQSHKPYHDSK